MISHIVSSSIAATCLSSLVYNGYFRENELYTMHATNENLFDKAFQTDSKGAIDPWKIQHTQNTVGLDVQEGDDGVQQWSGSPIEKVEKTREEKI